MPCTKCKDDKYKWGKTGECEYATKEACESANHKYNKMQPTPLGKKSYEEYAKELKEFNNSNELKLSSVKKIELSIASDIKSGAKDLPKIIKASEKISQAFEKDGTALQKIVNRINDNVKKARTQMDVGFAITDEGKGLIEEAEKKMSDLGLDPNDMPGFKEFKNLRSDAYYAVKGMDDAWYDFVSGIEPEKI